MFAIILILVLSICAQEKIMDPKEYNPLTREEERIILFKGTERPFSGEYTDHFEKGTYVCKRCDAPLFKSDDKFKSSCGWPSFDDEIKGAVKRQRDADGSRTEILCANCGGHLGHVFTGEGLTRKNLRHCVNSVSMKFVPEQSNFKKAWFAGGCFWGVEYHFEKTEGVISAVSGYMGGRTDNPTYRDVCNHTTGHVEAVEVTYNPRRVSYEKLARLFFEIHDPTQANGQGPDIGEQYLSVVFYSGEAEKKTVRKLIGILKEKGYDVTTKIRKADRFWEAEAYHQDYYERKGSKPYCHIYQKRF